MERGKDRSTIKCCLMVGEYALSASIASPLFCKNSTCTLPFRRHYGICTQAPSKTNIGSGLRTLRHILIPTLDTIIQMGVDRAGFEPATSAFLGFFLRRRRSYQLNYRPSVHGIQQNYREAEFRVSVVFVPLLYEWMILLEISYCHVYIYPICFCQGGKEK